MYINKPKEIKYLAKSSDRNEEHYDDENYPKLFKGRDKQIGIIFTD